MDINLHDYIFRQTKDGKYFRFRLEDGFMTGMGDNGYRFIVNETLFPQKLASLFDEWIHGYLSNKLTNDMTYGVGNFKFEINEGSLQLNCMTELGGSFYEFEYCCLSDNVLRELFRNQGPSEYSEVFVGLNFEYEFNYISNTWKISGFEDSYFYDSDGNTENFDFSKIQINCLKKKIYEEIKDYSLEEIGLEKGNISKKIVSIDSSIIVSEYISFIVPIIKP